jgi:hypothetical protein
VFSPPRSTSVARLALVALLGVSLAACSESPSAPAPSLDVSGQWRGEITDLRADSRRSLSLSLEQSGSSITGSAVSSLWATGRGTSVATVRGAVTSEGQVQLTFRSIEAGGCFDLDARLARLVDGTLSGDYTVLAVGSECGRRRVAQRLAIEMAPR